MNEKEIAEIRRRMRQDRNNITQIRGCYVNEKHEVISMFGESLKLIPQEEAERYLTLFKRTLSGTVGKNLIDITFSTAQVADSEEHRLLSALKNSALKDDAAVQQFFDKVMTALELEGQYLILLAYDTYDVPFRGADGEEMQDASTEMYSYILCTVCPVKLTRPALSYSTRENEFRNRSADWVVAPPELGFLFPAFDDRATNLYNALYYTKDIEESRQEFIDAVFRTDPLMPAAVQKETFQSVLAGALAEECRYDVVQAVHEQLREKIAIHKESHDPEPLTVSKRQMQDMLEECGVSESHCNAFEARFETQFGDSAELSPKNLVDANKFELRTPDVVIKVSPDRSDLIETRIINGRKYILIEAGEGVEVNGVSICINDED